MASPSGGGQAAAESTGALPTGSWQPPGLFPLPPGPEPTFPGALLLWFDLVPGLFVTPNSCSVLLVQNSSPWLIRCARVCNSVLCVFLQESFF